MSIDCRLMFCLRNLAIADATHDDDGEIMSLYSSSVHI